MKLFINPLLFSVKDNISASLSKLTRAHTFCSHLESFGFAVYGVVILFFFCALVGAIEIGDF